MAALSADMLEATRQDLDDCLLERSRIRLNLSRLERQGSVSVTVREKFGWQLAALDRWIACYMRALR